MLRHRFVQIILPRCLYNTYRDFVHQSCVPPPGGVKSVRHIPKCEDCLADLYKFFPHFGPFSEGGGSKPGILRAQELLMDRSQTFLAPLRGLSRTSGHPYLPGCQRGTIQRLVSYRILVVRAGATPLVSRYSCRATLVSSFFALCFRSVARESRYTP